MSTHTTTGSAPTPLASGASGFPHGYLPLPVDGTGCFQEATRKDLADGVYPGNRPEGSFVWHNGSEHRVRASDGEWFIEEPLASGSWTALDDWLAAQGFAQMDQREMCLAYGSNLANHEIADFADERPVIALAALTLGASAVYCSTERGRGQYPAGLVASSQDRGEMHGVLLVDDRQRRKLDRKEGTVREFYVRSLAHDEYLDLVLEDGSRCAGPIGLYAQGDRKRRIATVNGQPILLTDMHQEHFSATKPWDGDISDHGLAISRTESFPTLTTQPLPMFVYGTLRPGEIRYPLIEDLVSTTDTAVVNARFIETGQDYPGVVPSSTIQVSGVLLNPIEGSQQELLKRCDRIEGHPDLFQRALIRTHGADLAWIYFWNHEVSNEDVTVSSP